MTSNNSSHARCLWSVPASVLCCIFLSVLLGGSTIVRIVKVFEISPSVSAAIFGVEALLVALGSVLLIFLYFQKATNSENVILDSGIYDTETTTTNSQQIAEEPKSANSTQGGGFQRLLRPRIHPEAVTSETNNNCGKLSVLKVAADDKKDETDTISTKEVLPAGNIEEETKERIRTIYGDRTTEVTEETAACRTATPSESCGKSHNITVPLLDRLLDKLLPEMHDYEHAYTKFCAFVLGLGSFAYYAFLAHGQITSDRGLLDCPQTTPGVGPILLLLFISVQAWLFIDPLQHMEALLSNMRARSDWIVVAVRYSFMIFFAGNFSLWVYSVATEAYEDYCKLEQKLLEPKNDSNSTTLPAQCRSSASACFSDSFVKTTEYLVPLVAEFGLFMCQALVSWFHETLTHSECQCEPQPENLSVMRQGKWGIIAGLLILGSQIISLSIYQFFERDFGAEMVDGSLCLMSIFVSVAMLIQLDKLNLKARNDSVHFEETVHLMFLLMTYISMLIYSGASAMRALFLSHDNLIQSMLTAIASLIGPTDGTLQVIVVWVITYKEGSEVKKQSSLLNLMIFQFFQSLAIWAAASYRYVHASHHVHGQQSQVESMLVITHVTVPMVIYFRFQLAETWNHFYT